jgi:hypothetical protein
MINDARDVGLGCRLLTTRPSYARRPTDRRLPSSADVHGSPAREKAGGDASARLAANPRSGTKKKRAPPRGAAPQHRRRRGQPATRGAPIPLPLRRGWRNRRASHPSSRSPAAIRAGPFPPGFPRARNTPVGAQPGRRLAPVGRDGSRRQAADRGRLELRRGVADASGVQVASRRGR